MKKVVTTVTPSLPTTVAKQEGPSLSTFDK